MSRALQLRRLVLRCISSPSLSSIKPNFLSPPLLDRSSISPFQNHYCFLNPSPSYPSSRDFSSSSSSNREDKLLRETEKIAQAISTELLKEDATAESLSLTQRLDLHFSHIRTTPSLLLQVLNLSPEAGRTVSKVYKLDPRFSKKPKVKKKGVPHSLFKFHFNSSTPCLSQYRQLISFANLLQRYGFPSSQIHDFLRKNQFLLSFSLIDVEKSLGILLSLKLSQKSIVSILSACPGILELGFLKKWEVGFSELGFSTVSPLLIQSILEHCKKLQIEPTDLCKSLKVFKDVGFSDKTVSRVLEEFPRVIRMKPHDIDPKIEFFKRIGFQWDDIDRIFLLSPVVIGFSIDDRLKPLLKEFEDLGFVVDEVRREVIRNPQILTMDVGELSRCIDLLKDLKCRTPIEMKISGMGAFGAAMEVKLRVDCLCRHGLIRRDAFKVLQKEPRLIIYELEEIEKKIEFLIQRMGFSINCVIEVPEYLGVNFDKQIVPRYNVIEYLRLKGGLGREVGLKGLIKPSRLKFYNLYVKPYPECENIYGRFSRHVEVKPRHPPGLWKLFKPPSYPDSKEDLRNIKSFMETLS